MNKAICCICKTHPQVAVAIIIDTHNIGFYHHSDHGDLTLLIYTYEPRREKTVFLHMRKQRRRSASR